MDHRPVVPADRTPKRHLVEPALLGPLVGVDAASVLRDPDLLGGPGRDSLFGGAGDDSLFALDGVAANDTIRGGTGRDLCTKDPGDTATSCP